MTAVSKNVHIEKLSDTVMNTTLCTTEQLNEACRC